MAGPNRLDPGESVEFPTWALGRSTRLCGKTVGRGQASKVRVNAGSADEYFDVNNDGESCIDRNWAGIKIGVANAGDNVVEVWTA